MTIVRNNSRKSKIPNVGSTALNAMILVEKITTWLGSPSTYEEYYISVFFFSIAFGVIYGYFDKTFFYIATAYLPRQQSAVAIFLHNFSLDLLSVVTGGAFGLLSNFVTFAALPGLLESRHLGFLKVIEAIVVTLSTYGLLEIAGGLCLSLTGFTYLEKIAWKKKTRLHRDHLFIFGVVLVAVAASIEWLLGIYVPRPPG